MKKINSIKGIKKNMSQLFLPDGAVCPVTSIYISDLEAFSILQEGLKLTISGRAKGKGFAGVVKRWNFAGGPKTHGSGWLRKPGSIGGTTSPGRVYRGKKMPGRLGGHQVTIKNCALMQINLDQKTILISGPCPGSLNSEVFLYADKKDLE